MFSHRAKIRSFEALGETDRHFPINAVTGEVA
jgi:hypothetical protein